MRRSFKIENYLARSRVLIVERNELIAATLEDLLKGLGCISTRVVHNAIEAMAITSKYLPTLALLSLSVAGSGPSFDVADYLDDRSIAFVFASGYFPSVVPRRHRDRAFVHKPFDDENVARAIRAVMAVS